jgi:hypothetical protein
MIESIGPRPDNLPRVGDVRFQRLATGSFQGKIFPGVEDVEGVEKQLDPFLQRDQLGTHDNGHIGGPLRADAVLAADGPPEAKDDPVELREDSGEFFLPVLQGGIGLLTGVA